MAGGLLTMSNVELDRLGVVRRVIEGRLLHKEAALMMGVGVRRVARLCAAYERDGAAGLVSKRRGKASNSRLSEELRAKAVTIVRDRYGDFGPTLAAEKLAELHDLRVSRETLRHWMKAEGLWRTRKDRAPAPHQPRFRRECLGELVQIDGCEHAWFEDRGPSCSLLVYVDDATSRLMELLFAPSESAFSYFSATTSYLRRHGKPVAFYSDKHSVFRPVRPPDDGTPRGMSQFGRALSELNVDIICANTPQAKGRVERMNKTLQDRLVKELRLRSISTVTDGNVYLPTFMEDYNARFARPPRSSHDAHRALLADDDLERIFCLRETRKMSSNLVVQYDKAAYLVTPGPETKGLAGRRRTVEVHRWADGRMKIMHQGRELPFKLAINYPYIGPGEEVERKRVGEFMALVQRAQEGGAEARAAERLGAIRAAPPRPAKRSPRPPKALPPASIIELPPLVAGEPVASGPFVVRWVRKQAYLYERRAGEHTTAVGRKVVKDAYLGPVDSHVAQRWQERGDWSVPPPLLGRRRPAAKGVAPSGRSRRPRSPAPPDHHLTVAATPVDGRSRLNSALFFTDVFQARQTESIRSANEAADEEARAYRESLKPRKTPRNIPPSARVSAQVKRTMGS